MTVPAFKIPVVCLTADMIGKMTMRERRAYYDVLRQTENMVGAFACQPRFERSEHFVLNAAGELLEGLQAFLCESIDVLVKVTTADRPDDPEEAEDRAWMLLRYEVDCGEDLPKFVAIAALEAAAVSSLEFGQEARA